MASILEKRSDGKSSAFDEFRGIQREGVFGEGVSAFRAFLILIPAALVLVFTMR